MDIRTIYNQSYVPYSNQPEAAVVRSSEGRYFPGMRIENISYPLSISAAQTALFCCLSEGDTPQQLMLTQSDDRLLTFWETEFSITTQKLNFKELAEINFAPILIEDIENPTALLPDLLKQARVSQSNFRVSALIKTESGYVSGVNIECQSWNMGLCAERVAIAKALTYGQSELSALHVHTQGGEFSSPCGACRQVINEHLPHQKIHLHHADGSHSVHFSNDLLPFSFQSTPLSKS